MWQSLLECEEPTNCGAEPPGARIWSHWPRRSHKNANPQPVGPMGPMSHWSHRSPKNANPEPMGSMALVPLVPPKSFPSGFPGDPHASEGHGSRREAPAIGDARRAAPGGGVRRCAPADKHMQAPAETRGHLARSKQFETLKLSCVVAPLAGLMLLL